MKHLADNGRERLVLAACLVMFGVMLTAGYAIHSLENWNEILLAENHTLHEELTETIRTRDVLSKDLAESRTETEKLERDLLFAHERELAASDSPSFEKNHPELYVQAPAAVRHADPDVVYLTFDDGPFPMTDQYLDILKKHGAKVTFFVVGRNGAANRTRLKRIVDEGHSLGIHTYSHQYKQIYASVPTYLADFAKMNALIVQSTGVQPTIFRFPGGSVNSYNTKTNQQIIAEMKRRGYTYYDWNFSVADAMKGATAQSVHDGGMRLVGKKGPKVVLLHEGKTATLEALEGLIVELQAKGYKFDKLTNEIAPVCFSLAPSQTAALDEKAGKQ